MRIWIAAACASLLVGSAARANIADSCSIEWGRSDSTGSDVTLLRIGLQKDWREWYRGEAWHIGSYWDLNLGRWRNDSQNATDSKLWDLGFAPTFRLERNETGRWNPYLDGAIGFHFLSHASVSERRRFGCAFEFGDHVGVGLRFGAKRSYDLGYRFQHVSNAGIAAPNRGINFHIARFGVQF